MKKKNEIIAVAVALALVGVIFFWGKGFMNGETAKDGDLISIHYTGTLQNGVKFDSSLDRGQPFEFTLGVGQVIKGFDNGIRGMKVGEKKRIVIKPEDGYGTQAVGSIPPNSTLIFDVELLGIAQ